MMSSSVKRGLRVYKGVLRFVTILASGDVYANVPSGSNRPFRIAAVSATPSHSSIMVA